MSDLNESTWSSATTSGDQPSPLSLHGMQVQVNELLGKCETCGGDQMIIVNRSLKSEDFSLCRCVRNATPGFTREFVSEVAQMAFLRGMVHQAQDSSQESKTPAQDYEDEIDRMIEKMEKNDD